MSIGWLGWRPRGPGRARRPSRGAPSNDGSVTGDHPEDGSDDHSDAAHESRLAFDVALSAANDQMGRVADAVGAVAATNAALDRDELAAVLGKIVELAAKI